MSIKRPKWRSYTSVGLMLLLIIAASFTPIIAQNPVAPTNPYLMRSFMDNNGRQIDEIIVPERPPAVKAAAATVPEPDSALGINILPDVPAFDWCYGCSATSAAMMFGYYDRTGYPSMYTGSTNGGVCPLTNSAWGNGECPLSATHQGIDGLAVKGHVDDYWYSYSSDVDPYYGNWQEHTYAGCTADFMGTNQYQNWKNKDGATTFYYYTNGAPLYDYSGCEPGKRDGTHGMRLFVESRNYTVFHDGVHFRNYNQYVDAYQSGGFTYAQFKAEIDAGRPVMIQIAGHSMLGFGYSDPDTIYLHDTWDHNTHTMTWGGYYADKRHYGVSVLQLDAVAPCGTMGVNPTSWSPTVNAGSSASQTVTISAIEGPVNGVTVSKMSGPAWLTNSPSNLGDITAGSSKTVTLTAAPPAGTSGEFDYTVRVNNTCGTPTAQDVTGTIHVPDTTPPSVTVTSPDGGENWQVGSTHAITWTATDTVGVTSIDITYSTDGGSSYPFTIATGIANTGTYSWTIPNTPSTTCKVNVIAHDAAGNTGEDASNATFAITTPSANTVYPEPQNSCAPYSNTVAVQIWADTTDEFGVGQINLTYDSSCANVTNFEYGPLFSGFSTWDSTVAGREWLVFTRLGTVSGTVLIGTLTIQCGTTSECETPLTFAPPSKLNDPFVGDLIVTWIGGTFNCTPLPQLCTNPDPPSHDFGTVPEGQTATWTFAITNCGENTLTWTVSDDQPWITSSPTSGDTTTETDTVTVTINTTGLTCDAAHTGTVTVSSNEGTKTGTITVYVPPCPQLCTNPDPPSHDFGTVPEGQTATWTFAITNCGENTLTWTVSDDQPWITSSPTSGDTTTETDTVTVTINTTGLTCDAAHTGTVTVSSNEGTKTGTITVYVPPCPQLCTNPDPPSHDFGTVPEGQTATWTFAITNCGENTLTWTVSDDQPWITITPASGDTTTETDTVTVTINTTGLTCGAAHTGTVTVSSNEGTKTGTITVYVPPCPQLCTNPDPPSHDFGTVPEGQTATWTFAITNCGENTLTWTVSDDQPWITITPASGDTTTETDTVTVTINTTGLTCGAAHTGTVTVSSNEGTKTGTITGYVPPNNDVYLEPQNSSARYGNTVDVAIWANTTDSFGAGQINLTSTPGCVNVTNWVYGPLWQGTWDSSSDGREWLVFIRPLGEPAVNGTVLIGTLTIQCCNNHECESALSFAPSSTLNDPATGDLLVTWAEGIFSCHPQLCGDVTCDDVVDVSDVGRLLYHVGFSGDPGYPICNEWAADVNCDGKIDVSDVGLLLYHVGFPEDLRYALKCCS